MNPIVISFIDIREKVIMCILMPGSVNDNEDKMIMMKYKLNQWLNDDDDIDDNDDIKLCE